MQKKEGKTFAVPRYGDCHCNCACCQMGKCDGTCGCECDCCQASSCAGRCGCTCQCCSVGICPGDCGCNCDCCREGTCHGCATTAADDMAGKGGVGHVVVLNSSGTEYKAFGDVPQTVNDRTVTGICAVFGNVDDGGDRLWSGAFAKTIKENKGRVRHLWNHDADQPPTAVIRDLREISRAELPADLLNKFPDAKGGLQVTREYLNTPRAEEILAGIRAGAINEMSFAFLPVRKDFEHSEGKSVRNLREVKILDTSDVPWGMNPASRAIKGTLPFKAHPTAALDAPWDEAKEVAKAELADLKMMCAWTTDTEAKNSYALAHHRADNGHSVVWRGVAAAMSALTSGKAAVPPEARRAIFDHLAQHYEQFGQEPPDYTLVDFAYSVADVKRLYAETEGKIGRMISANNMTKLKAAIDTLQQILLAAAPPDPETVMEKARTVRGLFLEFEQAELDMERLGVKHE